MGTGLRDQRRIDRRIDVTPADYCGDGLPTEAFRVFEKGADGESAGRLALEVCPGEEEADTLLDAPFRDLENARKTLLKDGPISNPHADRSGAVGNGLGFRIVDH